MRSLASWPTEWVCPHPGAANEEDMEEYLEEEQVFDAHTADQFAIASFCTCVGPWTTVCASCKCYSLHS